MDRNGNGGLDGGARVGCLPFRDEIKSAIIGELNRHLQAEVRVDPADIEVTILSTFPHCALELRDVLMLEALRKKQRDTLLYAGKVRLHFSVLDIWRGRYEVKKLSISNGLARPAVSSDGHANYIFWKPSGEAAPDSTRFLLDDVLIKDMRLVYHDQQADLHTNTHIRELRLKGDFSSDRYMLKARSDLWLADITAGQTRYLSDKRLRLDIDMNVHGGAYQVRGLEAKLNGVDLTGNGNFTVRDGSLRDLELRYDAPGLDVAALLSLVPNNFRGAVADYESTGLLFLNGSVRYARDSWSANGSFGANNAVISYRPGSTRAEDVTFTGSFEFGDLQKVEVRQLRAQLAGGQIGGALKVTDFSDPRIVCEVSASGDLQKLLQFFPVDTLEELRGSFKLDLGLAGRWEAMKQAKLTGETSVRLQCGISNFYARFRHDPTGFSVTGCELFADQGELAVKNLRLERGASQLVINGRLPGFVAYLTDAERRPLVIKGDLYSPVLHVEDFLPAGNAVSAESAPPGAIIPGDLSLELESRIDQLAFGKFRARSVHGQVEVRNRKLMVSDLGLETMQGKAVISVLADNSRDRLQVSSEARLSHINLRDLFTQMDNFGQSTLRDDQIRGFANADIVFSGTWNNALECDLNSIAAGCDLDVDKGQLIGFKPLQSLGRFVEVKELEDIQFSKLHSRIDISSGRITIPRTSIRNSALDIEFWGSHTFEHRIDYHFQLLMTDLFAAKHKAFTNTEFGEVARDKDNRRSVFVLMTGLLDDPKIRYDQQGLKQKIRNDIAREKQDMKSLLKEEFGLFRKDESVKPVAAEQPVFRLEAQASQPPPKKELVLKKKDEEDF